MTSRSQRCLVSLIVLVVPGAVTPLTAQERTVPATTFRELAQTVRPGLRVEITTAGGAEERGRVELLDESSIRIRTGTGVHDFSESDVREVRRQGDRLWDGTLLGAGAGFLVGGFAGASASSSCGGEFGLCFVFFGAVVGAPVGALVGALLDQSEPHRDVLYSHSPQASRWAVVPVVGRAAYGARLVWRF